MLKKLAMLTLLFAGTLCMQVIYSGCCPDSNDCLTTNSIILTPLDNSGTKPELPKDSSVVAKALVLRLTIINKIEVCSHRQGRSFVNSAYAYTCKPRPKVPDSVTHISVISNQPYTAEYPAGSILNDLFVLPSLDEFYSDRDSASIDIVAKTGATNAGPHVFTVQAHFKSGAIKTATTRSINLVQ